jgi:chemotaxis protein MotB
MFDSGKADLNARSMEVIAAITPLLTRYEPQIRKIRIEGNTDNVPISNSQFRDNYELSMQRALVVLRYIRNKADFPPEKLVAIGYGEYYPIAGNDTEQGRAKNRRTDIILVGYAPADEGS